MGRIKAKNAKVINRIVHELKQRKISNQLVSIWTNVYIKTVSSWRSNTSQPSYDNLDDLADLLEIDNRLLFASRKRNNTGLAEALEKELKRLVTEENIPNVLEKKVGDTITRTNNPILIQALKAYTQKFRQENSNRLYPFYLDKSLKDVKKSEIRNAKYFICREDNPEDKFGFQVVSYANKCITPIASFTNLDDAQDYLEYKESF